MSLRIVIRDEAYNDLDTNSATIGEHSAQASVRYLDEARKAFEMIADMPGIGVLRDYGNPALAGIRMWPVSRFRKYLIFYLTTDSTIEIVRVLHGSRHVQGIFASAEDW